MCYAGPFTCPNLNDGFIVFLCSSNLFLGSLPDYGLSRNSNSIAVFTRADKRPLKPGQKLITRCKNPAVKVPPPVQVSVSMFLKVCMCAQPMQIAVSQALVLCVNTLFFKQSYSCAKQ
jgi:hypothetical protein